MTEGNIAAWRVKEGEKFAAGDVLLEIETDKATMDVEAQEDGILMKVMQGDGSKAVQVGARIAVIAEEGDDIASLQIPADETVQATKAAEAPETQTAATPASESTPPSSAAPKAASKPGAKKSQRTYPLLPSVAQLLGENGLDASAISDITPTGPNGRILKGDVLAFLGKISANTPAENLARFEKASHLDLSNINVAKAPEVKKPAKDAAAPPPPPVKAHVTVPVSLSAVIEAQRKIQKSLGVFLPLSTFISRASEVANDELPLPAGYQPTADELFNQVLGLDKLAGPKVSRGSYIPQIGALQPARAAPAKKADIFDILASKPKSKPAAKKTAVLPGASTGPNVFSLQVPKAEERRALVFLERIKVVLENEPGRLVL
jgi:hypothetical protein